MNTVEPFLEQIKLQQILMILNDKIDLDKEILLVYAHLKQEEKYLSSNEPILPLFKRYSLGYERVIQIWRRKCSADSLLNEAVIFSNVANNESANTDPNAMISLFGQQGNMNDFEDNTYMRLLKNIMQSNDVRLSGIERSLSGEYSRLAIANCLLIVGFL
jgi:hypothetical protein